VITIDLGRIRNVRALTYQPRLDGKAGGMITGYTVSVSKNGKALTTVARGIWPVSTATKVASWQANHRARYVRLTATATAGCSSGAPSAGEINVSTKPIRDMVTIGTQAPSPSHFDHNVPQRQMTATATSHQGTYPASNTIDGNCATLWYTEYSPKRMHPPQSITLNLGSNYNVNSLLYLPRQDGNPYGIITSYKIYVSQDGKTFKQVDSGTWAANDKQKRATFNANNVHYVRLEGVKAGGGYVSAAEINVAGTPAG
jgi:hypothetical protein